MKDFQETIDHLFHEIEGQLSVKLLAEGFQINPQISSLKDVGSKLTEWRNTTDQYAIRLVWDDKESCFIIDESPFMGITAPNSWADIVVMPVDRAKTNRCKLQYVLN